VLNVAVTVTSASVPVTGTFVLSGTQIDTYQQSGTFTVGITPLNGLAANTPISVTINSVVGANIVAASFSGGTVNADGSETVAANGSFSVNVVLLDSSTKAGLTQCAEVNAVIAGSGNTPEYVLLCVNAQINTNFSLPPSITVPSGGSVTVYAAVSPSYTGATVTVSCPAGIFPCDGTATIGTPANGLVPVTFSPGSTPVGTVATYTFQANEQGPIQCPVGTGPPSGGGTQPASITAFTNYLLPNNVDVTLLTDNDGSTGNSSYALICGTGRCASTGLQSCSLAGAVPHISLSTTTSSVPGASFGFGISAVADDQAIAGLYQINCSYFGTALSAGSLAVYDATPVITSVSPTTVTAGAVNSVTVTGHNFGNNPVVNIGGSGGVSVAFPGTGVGGTTQITGNFAIPSYPAGTQLPVTVTSTGESGNAFFQNPQNTGASHAVSNAVYVSAISATTVRILDANQSSLDITGSTSTISVGSQVSLVAEVLPSGTSYSGSQWLISSSCDPVGGYNANNQSGSVVPVQTSLSDSITFYCTQGNGAPGVVTVSFSATLTNGNLVSAYTSYTVTEPTVTVSVVQQPPSAVYFDQDYVLVGTNPIPQALPEMAYGGSGRSPGISCLYVPASGVAGSYQWIQVVNSSTESQTDGPTPAFETSSGLDTKYPTSINNPFTDSPVEPLGFFNLNNTSGPYPLETFAYTIRDDNFTLVLMYLPPAQSSTQQNLFVPIWSLTWTWGGTALLNPDGATFTVNGHQYVVATAGAVAFGSQYYPTWTQRVQGQ
jgi:hypothetical protein